jgi:hypothetical protein
MEAASKTTETNPTVTSNRRIDMERARFSKPRATEESPKIRGRGARSSPVFG